MSTCWFLSFKVSWVKVPESKSFKEPSGFWVLSAVPFQTGMSLGFCIQVKSFCQLISGAQKLQDWLGRAHLCEAELLMWTAAMIPNPCSLGLSGVPYKCQSQVEVCGAVCLVKQNALSLLHRVRKHSGFLVSWVIRSVLKSRPTEAREKSACSKYRHKLTLESRGTALSGGREETVEQVGGAETPLLPKQEWVFFSRQRTEKWDHLSKLYFLDDRVAVGLLSWTLVWIPVGFLWVWISPFKKKMELSH